MNFFFFLITDHHQISTMGGHDAGTTHQFTGMAKYFNSYTITGRKNVSYNKHYILSDPL